MGDQDTLLHFAGRVAQSPYDANALSNLVLRLQLCSDVAALRAVAARFPFHPEVSVRVWRRIAALIKDDAAALVEAGYAFYAAGADEDAAAAADDALAIDKELIPAWELKAALCADPAKRREVFEQILKIEPGNRTAVDNLILLGRPKE